MDKQLRDTEYDRYLMHPMLHSTTESIVAALKRGDITVPILLDAVARAVRIHEESKEQSNIEKLIAYAQRSNTNG